MTRWAAFAGLTTFVLIVLLSLARLSQATLTAHEETAPPPTHGQPATDEDPPALGPPDLPTTALLANVTLSQATLGAFLLAGMWLFQVPLDAVGMGPTGVDSQFLALGVGLGLALYVVNQIGVVAAEAFGAGPDDGLRALLAPEDAGEWALLLGVVLPVVAAFEELLFRGILVGALAAGFGISPWLLAVGSAVLFAAGHGVQGLAGIGVTGALGLVLAVAFILTGSLLVVVIAHYLVNVLEFVPQPSHT